MSRGKSAQGFYRGLLRGLRSLTALPDDLSLVSSTHIRQLPTACDSRSGNPLSSSGLSRHLQSQVPVYTYVCMHVCNMLVHMQTHTHTYTLMICL